MRKVRLQRDKDLDNPFTRNHPTHRKVPISACAPFYWSRRATRIHRIRWASIHYIDGEYSHTSIHTWCDQVGHVGYREAWGRITDDPPEDLPYCATCEGRAIGAGQLGAQEINGRPVIYSPRKPRNATASKAG